MVRAVAVVFVALLSGGVVFPQQAPAPRQAATAAALPARLSDADFWRLTIDLSEPNGFFRSENLVSNEHTYQYVIPALEKFVKPGGVYLGVAPDQNFTYMIASQPKMAFIVDIRRGNLLEHLLYKAIFELSADRADFLARLFSKKRPPGIGPKSSVVELFTAFDRLQTSLDQYKELYQQNVTAIREHLLRKHKFELSAADMDQLEGIYFAFFWEGPDLRYSMSPTGIGRQGFGGSNFPSYEELMLQTDWEGQARSYLANEENYRYIKSLEERNLIVPIVGNFAGPKALRAVGKYIRDRGSVVSAFYVSNVEQYLFQDSLFEDFAKNVATLPLDGQSTFIRSVSTRFGYSGAYLWTDGRASALDPMAAFVRDFQAEKIKSYYDVNARSK
jgi:hypothetical protein